VPKDPDNFMFYFELGAKMQSRYPRAAKPSLLGVHYSSSISSIYSFSKGVVAIFQTIYASVTLLWTKGDQINRYRYAAFGLTVTLYLMMSIVNLVGTLLNPDFPTMFLVGSEVMTEAARREGAKFEGIVATLHPGSHWCANSGNLVCASFTATEDTLVVMEYLGFHDPQRHETVEAQVEDPWTSTTNRVTYLIPLSPNHSNKVKTDYLTIYAFVGSMFFGTIVIAIIGGLSHFANRQSTSA
jgi:hypothetical protein